MIYENFQVRVHQNPVTNLVEIYLFDRHNGRISVFEPVQFIEKEIEDGAVVEPTFRFYGYLGEAFLQAMAEELDAKNIKTDKDAKIEGTLEATRYHLEDLRTLLKVNKGGK